MSLEAFQIAIADLVASPSKTIALQDDPALADAYALTPREKARLLAVVNHPGMSQNCTLYRANRLTPIARSLPRTCVRLGRQLLPELQAFWAAAPDSELQFRREAERFAWFLLDRIALGGLQDVADPDDIRLEMHELGVRFGTDFHP